jgi:hypothetical protein
MYHCLDPIKLPSSDYLLYEVLGHAYTILSPYGLWIEITSAAVVPCVPGPIHQCILTSEGMNIPCSSSWFWVFS